VQFIAEIECLADPIAERVVVEASKDSVPWITRRGHEKTLPTIVSPLLDQIVDGVSPTY
jgi:hypothetical protein